jgi:nicotinate-nucleotide--dimethylbenzimidazole phosphoribosyltransferase
LNSEWLYNAVKPLNSEIETEALVYQNQLTKPPGSLGRLEELAIRLSAMQGTLRPNLERVAVTVFAADHGVADEGVSAFPQVVTTEMVRNFANDGAAICVLARQAGASFEVVNLGTVVQLNELPHVVDARIAPSTANFCQGAAMDEIQLAGALDAGRGAVDRALSQGAQLFIGGDMGIANTTSASAIAAALLGCPASALAGPGTGVDAAGVDHKAVVISRALELHQNKLDDPYQVLRCLGGFEIAALVGAYVSCAQQGLPAVVDGFITSAAALVAVRLNPDVADWLVYSHASAEPGHQAMMTALNARPLLSFNMRLGEGSGAALVVPLLRSACALQSEMATFAEASVSDNSAG